MPLESGSEGLLMLQVRHHFHGNRGNILEFFCLMSNSDILQKKRDAKGKNNIERRHGLE